MKPGPGRMGRTWPGRSSRTAVTVVSPMRSALLMRRRSANWYSVSMLLPSRSVKAPAMPWWWIEVVLVVQHRASM
jgi:hypothetical protein